MRLLILSLLLGLSTPLWAADEKNGQALHDDNCQAACHTTLTGGKPNTLYTREDRRMGDYNALYNQVQRCALNLGMKWFDSEIEDVSVYLNTHFYKFSDGPADSKGEKPADGKSAQ